jgi:hypothetical protein
MNTPSTFPMEPAMNPTIPFVRAAAATELRHAAALRRDLAAGILPRAPALSAIRECLRQARACITVATLIGRLA